MGLQRNGAIFKRKVYYDKIGILSVVVWIRIEKKKKAIDDYAMEK